jgi:gliding motility-associated-like protein
MQNISCGGNPILPNIIFDAKTLQGVLVATYSTDDLPLTDTKSWKQYGLSFKTPADIDALVLTIRIDSKFGCGSAFVIDDITLKECGPSVTATIDGSPGPANVCADYTNPFILRGAYSAGFDDPANQWQSSMDTGRTWQDMPGETTTTYAIPRRLSGVILYRMAVAERATINSLNCRILSNPVYTEIHPLAAHRPPQNFVGCIGKDLILPPTDPKALKVLWSGPDGYLSELPVSIIPNVQYRDTGLYKLKETFYYGCVSLDTFYLKVFPGTTISTLPAPPVCEGMSVNLSATSSDGGNFKWTPALGLSNDTIPNPVASPRDSTSYKVVVTNSYGCKDSAYLNVNVFRNVAIDAGPDKTIVSGDSIILNGSVKGTAVNFNWTPFVFMNDSHSVNPKVYPLQDIVYTLNATSTVGCGEGSDDVRVKVYNTIVVPNAFTPNGDGINDKFQLIAFDNYKPVKLIIYNRFGTLIFKATDAYRSWDGKFKGILQPAGTYVYYLELKSITGKKVVKRGTIMLLR